MPLHRLLHRLDYSFNEIICDRPGFIINNMMEASDQRIPEVKDAAANRMLVADVTTEDNDVRWRVQVTPLNAYIGIEWKAPREIGNILKDPEVSAAFDVLTKVFEIAQIDLVARAGLRLFSFETINEGEPLQNALGKLERQIVSNVEKFGGKISDLGINFDGSSEDGIKFSVRHGPYFEAEQNRYFDLLKENWEVGKRYNFIADVDFAQANFRMKGQGPYKWSRSLLEKAKNLTDSLLKTGMQI
jgi:hypothetical protein